MSRSRFRFLLPVLALPAVSPSVAAAGGDGAVIAYAALLVSVMALLIAGYAWYLAARSRE